MKKIAILGILLTILSIGASAQVRGYRQRGVCNNRITMGERQQLKRDVVRVRVAQRMAGRDGVVTPVERVRIHRLKSKTRRDVVRFRYS